VSSIKLGQNTSVIVYENDKCTGSSLALTSDASSITTMNDAITSVAIFSTLETVSTNCVWLYEHCCFGGSKVEICSDTADFSSINFNDVASSIRLGSNVSSVIIYTNTNYSGTSNTYTEANGCFTTTGNNDQASSLRITLK